MSKTFISFVIAAICTTVSAELSVLSYQAANNHYSDVHSAYVEGYYVMLYVASHTGNSSFYNYSIGLYELVNGTQLVRPSGFTDDRYKIKSASRELRLTAEGNGGGLSNGIATVDVCSSYECARFFVAENMVTFINIIPWCNSNIKVTDQPLSVTEEPDYSLLVVARGAALYGFLCSSNLKYNMTFTCPGKLISTTKIHSVESTITNGEINVFVLLSNGEETVLCSFNQAISKLPNRIANVTSSSTLVLDYSPTALAVATASGDHIAFLSSSDGRVSKVYIQADGAYKIDEFIITPEITDVFSEILLANDMLLLVTTTHLILLDVKQSCELQRDLCSCRAPKDPKCGWCVNSNSCTNYAACNAEQGIWIQADPSSNNICWNATTNPSSVSRHNLEPMQISIHEDMGADKFVTFNNAYKCTFGTAGITLATNIRDQSLTCGAPAESALSSYPEGSLELPLVIYYETGEKYLPFLVYYKIVVCTDITNCGDCVRSHDSCTWCINDHKCTTTATVSNDCPNSNEPGTKSPYGDIESCPAITSESPTAPVNELYELQLAMNNLPTLADQSYYCRIASAGGGRADIVAAREGDNIKCSAYRYGSDNDAQSKTFFTSNFTVSVLLGDQKHELAKAEGQVYNCSYRHVCTQCVQIVGTTDCVWCSESRQCLYNNCPVGLAVSDICQSLEILSEEVAPKDLPVEGGITLRIPGRGLILDDGYSAASIEIAGQSCQDITPGPNTPPNGDDTDLLSCTVPQVEHRQKAQLKVIIDGISWERETFLNYYDPELQSLSVLGNNNHRYGPVAGGTNIKLDGEDLIELRNTAWELELVNIETHIPLNLHSCSVVSEAIQCKTPVAKSTGKYMVQLNFTDKLYIRNLTDQNELFEYKPDSSISGIFPDHVIAWGGKQFTVNGTHLDSVSRPLLEVPSSILRSDGLDTCRVNSSNRMLCTYPEFHSTGVKQMVIIMDGINTSLTTVDVTVTDNPDFEEFEEKVHEGQLILKGSNLDNVNTNDIMVFVGGQPCNITTKESSTILCDPPKLSTQQQKESTVITVEIYGEKRFTLGKLNYTQAETPVDGRLPDAVIGGIAGGGTAAVIIMVVVAVLLFRRSRYHKQRYLSMVKHVDQLECNSRHEIKQAFAELQTDMTDLMGDLNVTGIPYWDYKNFTFKILFPGQTDHPSLHKLMTKRKVAVMQALDMFEHLIHNKDFLLSFIHTLEQQRTFSMSDKVQLAALLMLTLQHKMDYTTAVIKELLSDLIKNSIRDKHPKLLLRRSESVVEKMLTHWLSLCLYKYLQDHAGTPLFMLYRAIKHQIDKGPVDALTGEARYSLSQERLLRLTVDTNPVTLNIVLENEERIQCKVNDIDTTTQVKEKILDVLYKNQAYSQRPCASDYNLEWHHGIVGVPICDEDLTSKTVNGWKQLNTLAHYGISDNATMKLVSRHRPSSLQSDRSLDTDKLCDTLSSNRGRATPRGTLSRNGALSTSNLQDHYIHNHVSLWHLVKSSGSNTLPEDRQQTMMSEIFLTRLLKTKGTLQEFIDTLFQTIFSAENLPPTIKFLFDFLDQEAFKHGITDPEVVHVWKNNSLNLRFWVNIIKNPEFVFDVHKSEVVDASLSTIAQTFIDSCAMTESDFGADAPINKLLFARDRPRYRKMLQNMYMEIRNKPQVPEQTLNAHLNELSKMYPREVYKNSALKEIYQFAQRYQPQILQDLEENFPKHRNPNLSTLLQDIHSVLDERQSHLTDYV